MTETRGFELDAGPLEACMGAFVIASPISMPSRFVRQASGLGSDPPDGLRWFTEPLCLALIEPRAYFPLPLVMNLEPRVVEKKTPHAAVLTTRRAPRSMTMSRSMVRSWASPGLARG